MRKQTRDYEGEFARQVAVYRLPPPVREHRFHPVRRWRFDFAWVEKKIALEIEGATWSGGRHTRGSGFEKDAEKYNEAALMGWFVFRATGGMVLRCEAIDLIKKALKTL